MLSKDEIKEQGNIVGYISISVSFFVIKYLVCRMKELVTILSGFQRFSFFDFLLKDLVTLSPRVDGEDIGVVDQEGNEAVLATLIL